MLRSDLAVFGTDLTHLCPAQGGATFLCRSSRTAGRTLSRFRLTHPADGPHASEVCLAGMGLLRHSMSQCHRMLAVFSDYVDVLWCDFRPQGDHWTCLTSTLFCCKQQAPHPHLESCMYISYTDYCARWHLCKIQAYKTLQLSGN